MYFITLLYRNFPILIWLLRHLEHFQSTAHCKSQTKLRKILLPKSKTVHFGNQIYNKSTNNLSSIKSDVKLYFSRCAFFTVQGSDCRQTTLGE